MKMEGHRVRGLIELRRKRGIWYACKSAGFKAMLRSYDDHEGLPWIRIRVSNIIPAARKQGRCSVSRSRRQETVAFDRQNWPRSSSLWPPCRRRGMARTMPWNSVATRQPSHVFAGPPNNLCTDRQDPGFGAQQGMYAVIAQGGLILKTRTGTGPGAAGADQEAKARGRLKKPPAAKPGFHAQAVQLIRLLLLRSRRSAAG